MMKSRSMTWTGHVASIREKRNAYRIFMGKPEGKKPEEKPRCRVPSNVGKFLSS
jgi:hypothetical protein